MFQRLSFALMYLRRPPWDTGVSPPELLDFLQSRPPGRALDLGCGTGTNVLTLAEHGWQVSGVDFIPAAIRKARHKARQAGLAVDLRVADVTRLSELSGPFDLALDMGCLHSLPPDRRGAYLDNLERWLAPGGTYLLYAFLRGGEAPGPRGLSEEEIAAMAKRLRLVKRVDSSERGWRPSAWLTWERGSDR